MIIKLFFPNHVVTGIDNVITNEVAIFVSNHSLTYGPMVLQLFFPFKYRPWVIKNLVTKKQCKKYLESNFLKKGTGIKEPFNKLLASLITPICHYIMKKVEAIPVYRGSDLLIFPGKKILY